MTIISILVSLNKGDKTMKKVFLLALIALMTGTAAFAQTATTVAMPKKVKCEVNGKVKTVKSAELCTSMGGKVVEPKKAA